MQNPNFKETICKRTFNRFKTRKLFSLPNWFIERLVEVARSQKPKTI